MANWWCKIIKNTVPTDRNHQWISSDCDGLLTRYTSIPNPTKQKTKCWLSLLLLSPSNIRSSGRERDKREIRGRVYICILYFIYIYHVIHVSGHSYGRIGSRKSCSNSVHIALSWAPPLFNVTQPPAVFPVFLFKTARFWNNFYPNISPTTPPI